MLNLNQQNQQRQNLSIPELNNEQVLDLMKEEIAQEFGITLGAETSSRDNGRVGGEVTKRLVKMAKEQLANQNTLH